MQLLTAHWPMPDWPLWVTLPSFYSGQDILWCGISLWPLWATCPTCVSSKFLPPHWQITRQAKNPWFRKSPNPQCAINPTVIPSPKHSTARAAGEDFTALGDSRTPQHRADAARTLIFLFPWKSSSWNHTQQLPQGLPGRRNSPTWSWINHLWLEGCEDCSWVLLVGRGPAAEWQSDTCSDSPAGGNRGRSTNPSLGCRMDPSPVVSSAAGGSSSALGWVCTRGFIPQRDFGQ